jgi:hypothetical protein
MSRETKKQDERLKMSLGLKKLKRETAKNEPRDWK